MADISRLVRASVALNGNYLNGHGREVTYTHEVVAGRRVSTILDDFDLVIRSLEGQKILERGPEAIQRSGLDRMDELDMRPGFVANVAMSELHPKWVLDERPGRVRDMAQLLFNSRVIAQTFHETELMIDQAR